MQKTIPIEVVEEVSSCSEREPFALMVLDDYMEPEFKEGDVIIVEPSPELAKDGAYIVARHEEEVYFRQLRIEDGRWVLVPLNPRHPSIEVAGASALVGVVTMKRERGRRRLATRYD